MQFSLTLGYERIDYSQMRAPHNRQDQSDKVPPPVPRRHDDRITDLKEMGNSLASIPNRSSDMAENFDAYMDTDRRTAFRNSDNYFAINNDNNPEAYEVPCLSKDDNSPDGYAMANINNKGTDSEGYEIPELKKLAECWTKAAWWHEDRLYPPNNPLGFATSEYKPATGSFMIYHVAVSTMLVKSLLI